MAILATLGDISFQVFANGFNSFKLNSRAGWASHPRLFGKPTLQDVGDELETITLDFTFHKKLVDTEKATQQLRKAKNDKKPLALVFGDLYKGQWIIESLEETPLHVSSNPESSGEGSSTVDIITLSVTLLEYNGALRRELFDDVTKSPFTYKN